MHYWKLNCVAQNHFWALRRSTSILFCSQLTARLFLLVHCKRSPNRMVGYKIIVIVRPIVEFKYIFFSVSVCCSIREHCDEALFGAEDEQKSWVIRFHKTQNVIKHSFWESQNLGTTLNLLVRERAAIWSSLSLGLKTSSSRLLYQIEALNGGLAPLTISCRGGSGSTEALWPGLLNARWGWLGRVFKMLKLFWWHWWINNHKMNWEVRKAGHWKEQIACSIIKKHSEPKVFPHSTSIEHKWAVFIN
jgi:hypothetical protein